jgi:two-component system cell cycle sensor histidine kinase PleC
MSHELRTPLNAIIGFSELMRSELFGPLTARYLGYLDDIHSSGSHLLEIVNAILQLSKLDAGKSTIELQSVSLRDAIADVQRIAGILADEKNIRLMVDLAGSAPFVLADRQALKQILLNLISNAIKFSPRDSSIEIFMEETGTMCAVYVRDRGCGIPPDTLAKIGQPFVQAEGVFSRRHQGTGLGLAICFSLARQMDASLEIESAPNLGTTVKFLLKRAPKNALTANAA